MKKKKSWVKLRHKIINKALNVLLAPYLKIKYGIKIKKHKEKRQYLILANHQTAFDQFFITRAMKNTVYFLASEDLFSNGKVSNFIRWAIAPIPIKKQTSDMRAVMTCMKVAKEGATIGIFPEGNRTYSGKTEYIKPSIVKLVKTLKLPLAFFKIEGGYGVYPRWSDCIRKGKMNAGISNILEPDDYLKLSDDELYNLICRELYVNEAYSDKEYKHKKLAEYLERAIYVCPDCGIVKFKSSGDVLTCTNCGKQVRYLPNKTFEPINCELPFKFVNDWYEYQSEFMNNFDLTPYKEKSAFFDTVDCYEVILYKNKNLLKENITLSAYSDRFELLSNGKLFTTLAFDQIIAVTILGRNKLNFYFGDKTLQFKGEKSFNALKYVNLFYHYLNAKENNDGKFLGL